MPKSNIEETLNFYFITIPIACIIVAGMVIFSFWLKENVLKTLHESMDEAIFQQKMTFSSKINDKIDMLKTISDLSDGYINENSSNQDILDFLGYATEQSTFKYLLIADKNGKAISNTGAIVDVSAREHYKNALLGKVSISVDPMLSLVDGSKIIAIAVPIARKNEEVSGVLIGNYDTNELKSLFFASYNDAGHAYIVDGIGDFITATHNSGQIVEKHQNIIDYFKQVEKFNYGNWQQVALDKDLLKSGHVRVMDNDKYLLAHYTPVGINNWYIFTFVYEDDVSKQASLIMGKTAMLSFFIMGIFLLLLAYVIYANKKSGTKLFKMAYFNELTGAPNLAHFKAKAENILNTYCNETYMLVRFHINKIDILNESYGSEIGDKLLLCTANALKQTTDAKTEVYAHEWGNKFYILLNCASIAEVLARRKIFDEVFESLIGDFGHKTNFIYGQYLIQKNDKFSLALEKVSFAHKQAKSGNENKVFDQTEHAKRFLESDLENQMDFALENNEFKMFLQAKYSLSDKTIVGAEALVRWKLGGSAFISPGDFIPLFEKNGFITKLDFYMFRKACIWVKEKLDSGIIPVPISVNFSRRHLENAYFIPELAKIADEIKVPHEYLEIELLESTMHDDEDMLTETISMLREYGFSVSIDDFGTGYSSLGLLRTIPIDVIKMDRSFFNDDGDELRSEQIIESVVDMSRKLKIKVVAEGIETAKQVEMLTKINCDYVQGFYFAKPIPAEELKLSPRPAEI